jgi:hypothetical protein
MPVTSTFAEVWHPALASGSDCFDPFGTLHPVERLTPPPFARPSASSFATTGFIQLSPSSAGPCSTETLDRLARPDNLAIILLRNGHGSQPMFQASISLRKLPL